MIGETFDVYGILAEQCLGLATLDGKVRDLANTLSTSTAARRKALESGSHVDLHAAYEAWPSNAQAETFRLDRSRAPLGQRPHLHDPRHDRRRDKRGSQDIGKIRRSGHGGR